MSQHSTQSLNIDRIRIATPCPIGWEQMTGDNRVRFCELCQLNVYNIAELSRTETEALIASTEGRICARMYRRADGTVLTKDCPVGLRALRLRVSKKVAAVFAAIASISSVALGQKSAAKDGKTECTQQTKIASTIRSADPQEKPLAGTVKDPNGAVVAGATVTLTNPQTKETRSELTNDEGRFGFSTVLPGKYSIEIAMLGFKSVKIEDVNVTQDKLTDIQTILEPHATELIGVVATDPSLPATPGATIISGDLIRKLPIR
jgi:hypothetical protein